MCRREAGRRLCLRPDDRRGHHGFSPPTNGGVNDAVFLDFNKMATLLTNAQKNPARKTMNPWQAGRRRSHNSWKLAAISGSVCWSCAQLLTYQRMNRRPYIVVNATPVIASSN